MSAILDTHDQCSGQSAKTGWAQFWVDRHFHDLEYMHSMDRQHCFGPHTHDTFVLGSVERGGLTYHSRGCQASLASGQVLAINPGDLHDCRPAEGGASYRMLYPSDRMMEEVADTFGIRGGRPPRFVTSTLDDPELAVRVCRLHRLSQAGIGRLTSEGEMLDMLGLLFSRHGDAIIVEDRVTGDRRLVRHACAYLEEHLDRDVSLSELSDQLAVNQFRLIREFRKVAGLTPHAYLTNRRLGHAKKALAQGRGLAQTAVDFGFWDQSHFHRWFKRAFGITPKAYQDAYRA